jgi:hypothetical protein
VDDLFPRETGPSKRLDRDLHQRMMSSVFGDAECRVKVYCLRELFEYFWQMEEERKDNSALE